MHVDTMWDRRVDNTVDPLYIVWQQGKCELAPFSSPTFTLLLPYCSA